MEYAPTHFSSVLHLATPYYLGRYAPPKYAKPFTPSPVWKRKTCKTCALYADGRCGHCGEELKLYRVKPKHAACKYYKISA